MEAGKELGMAWRESEAGKGGCPCLAGQACFLRSQGMRELGPHYTLLQEGGELSNWLPGQHLPTSPAPSPRAEG